MSYKTTNPTYINAEVGMGIGKASLVSAIIEQCGIDGYLEFLASVKAGIEAEKANG